jgi:hypothetical protein
MVGSQVATTVYQLQQLFSIKWHEWVNMFGEVQRIEKGAIVAYFITLPSVCLERLRKP